MKKLLILPLFVGVFLLCFAAPSPTPFRSTSLVAFAQHSGSNILDNVFAAASHIYQERYGVEMSVSSIWDGYQDGTITVYELVQGESWEVDFGGGILIAIDEDNI